MLHYDASAPQQYVFHRSYRAGKIGHAWPKRPPAPEQVACCRIYIHYIGPSPSSSVKHSPLSLVYTRIQSARLVQLHSLTPSEASFHIQTSPTLLITDPGGFSEIENGLPEDDRLAAPWSRPCRCPASTQTNEYQQHKQLRKHRLHLYRCSSCKGFEDVLLVRNT